MIPSDSYTRGSSTAKQWFQWLSETFNLIHPTKRWSRRNFPVARPSFGLIVNTPFESDAKLQSSCHNGIGHFTDLEIQPEIPSELIDQPESTLPIIILKAHPATQSAVAQTFKGQLKQQY